MALPSNITTIVLTGQYLDFEGQPIAGQVKIYPSKVLIDSAADRIIIPYTLTADLVNGAFSLTVPITNDVDISPLAFTYYFEESFTGGSTYQISLPASLGSTVDIATIREAAVVPSYIQPVSYDLWPALVARLVTQELYYDNAPLVQAPTTYTNLALYSQTYATLASDWSVYGNLTSTMEMNFSLAKVNAVLGRITALTNYSATGTQLNEVTGGGTVSSGTYGAHMAKYGTYQNWSNQYSTYSTLTGTSVSWTYAQIGTLLTNIGYAINGSLTDTTSITDNYLKKTRTISGNSYGNLSSTGFTYSYVQANYATYAALALAVFSNTVRDTADTLKTAVNHPHPLLTKDAQYGINI